MFSVFSINLYVLKSFLLSGLTIKEELYHLIEIPFRAEPLM